MAASEPPRGSVSAIANSASPRVSFSQPGLDDFGLAVLRQDLAVQRGQQVDVGDAQVGAGDLLVDHAGRQAAQALAAELLRAARAR